MAASRLMASADERSEGKRDDLHSGTGGRQGAAADNEHLLHGAAQADKQDAQPRCFHERVLMRGVIKRPPANPKDRLQSKARR